MISIPSHPVTLSATLVGLQLNPIYDSAGNLRNIKVVALTAGTPPVAAPSWAQPNRRGPTMAEMAAITAVAPNPGEAIVPTWLERAAGPFMAAVYGDLITPPAAPDKK
jgi:hypothetical protein